MTRERILKLIASRPRSDKAVDLLSMKPPHWAEFSPEELKKAQDEWLAKFKAEHDEFERIGKICNTCRDGNSDDYYDCEFGKLKGCTKKRLIRNSLGPAKELIQCPKGLLYKVLSPKQDQAAHRQ